MTITDQQNTNTALPLDSLSVKGYRAFKDLTIPKLGRVNLITGKNNVGKTSLLEAIRLYARGGSPSVIRDILMAREELGTPLKFAVPFGFSTKTNINSSEDWMPYVTALLHGRPDLFEVSDNKISIGAIDRAEKQFELSIRWGIPNAEATGAPTYLSIDKQSSLSTLLSAAPYMVLKAKGRPEISLAFDQGLAGSLYWVSTEQLSTLSISSNGLQTKELADLWDRIAITDLEQEVVASLGIIEQRIERLTFAVSNELTHDRIPYVKLSTDDRVPLRSLGDGINRLLSVSLSMTNARDGILLLDEIENGLHYSILSEVWEWIFKLARHNNVQVFATTHSWECIEAFQAAASKSEAEGALIRLRSRDGDIKATVFDEHDLDVITRDLIEVR